MSNMAKKYELAMAEATNYEEWRLAALVLDHLDGLDKWREEPESADYDHKLLASRVRLLRQLRRRKDIDRLIFRLREELHGNLGNMANPALYQRARVGTKKLVTDYIEEVCAALNLLCDSEVENLPPMRKRIFLKRAARSFGRSALLLSGGASLGLFHIAVIRELETQGILPRVITGSSAGSIVAGILATHTDKEWEQLIGRDDWRFDWARLVRLTDLGLSKGLLDQKVLQRCIDQNIPDMTFLEAYQHTNRILNITVSPADSHQFPRLLNYLTAPNVLVRRAALASAAIPGIFPPVQLRARNFEGKSVAYMPQNRWIDGSVHEDIPKQRVNRLHNVNHYIVSQTNPYVVPFLNEEIEHTGLLPFLQDVVIKAPMVQLEHLLELVQQHFDIPGLGSIIKKAHAMARQTYSGDITIYPERSLLGIGRMFNNLGPRQLEAIMLEGRRATWPKLERIRNTTQISRTFDACLLRMSERYRYVKR
jgi:TAG lipase / steryl ester hydrolase / phospholipase A2 / LPA acyltransferase